MLTQWTGQLLPAPLKDHKTSYHALACFACSSLQKVVFARNFFKVERNYFNRDLPAVLL